MPTLSPADVTAVADLILRLLPVLEAEMAAKTSFPPWAFPPMPGCIAYPRLVDACAAEFVFGKRNPRHFVRAACELLADQGKVELFIKSKSRKKTRNRCDRVLWVRRPGKRERWYEAPPRPRGRPDAPPKNLRPACALEHRISPEVTGPIEAVILQLLVEGISDQDMLACSNFATPPPGEGWRPHAWIVTRTCFRTPITPGSRHNMVGLSLRRLAERNMVEILGGYTHRLIGPYRPRQDGALIDPETGRRRCWRVKWARLCPRRAQPVPSALPACLLCPSCLARPAGPPCRLCRGQVMGACPA